MCDGTRVCTPAVSGISRPCPVCRRESYPPFDAGAPAEHLRAAIERMTARGVDGEAVAKRAAENLRHWRGQAKQ